MRLVMLGFHGAGQWQIMEDCPPEKSIVFGNTLQHEYWAKLYRHWFVGNRERNPRMCTVESAREDYGVFVPARAKR